LTQAYMPQDQIQELGRRWAKAELQGDTETLGKLLDADFVCVGPVGFVINKEQYLAGRRSGDLTQQAFAWEDVQVRVHGEAAVAVGTQVQQTTMQGRDTSGRFRATQVLARKADDWRIASLHLSPITPAPGWILGALQAAPGAQPPSGQGGAR
jgi:ketosteroid isomerase-like protein